MPAFPANTIGAPEGVTFHPARTSIPSSVSNKATDSLSVLTHKSNGVRRFRTVEAQLWQHEIDSAFRSDNQSPLGQAFSNHAQTFTRLQRRIDAAERSCLRLLETLRCLQSARPEPAEDPQQPPVTAPQAPPCQSPIGFVPHISPHEVPTPSATGSAPPACAMRE